MAFMRLGSKSEAFHREGGTWLCTTGLVSDVTIEVGEMKFHLHKFPLISRSGLLERLIDEYSNSGDGSGCVLQLDEIPGGGKAFELVTKFCYGVKIDVTATNVVSLRCAAEYLQMTEKFEEGNLIKLTEGFLDEVFGNWTDSIRALQTCEEVMNYAEELHIISRCIDSLAMKACADPSIFNWPTGASNNTGKGSEEDSALWNGISTANKSNPIGEDWWYEDVSSLTFPLYKRLMLAIEARGMKIESIASAVAYYTRKNIPLMNRNSCLDETTHVDVLHPSESDQRFLLEEIVSLIPRKKGVSSTKFLLRLLHIAMMLQASQTCRDDLEKRIGAQLDQAALVDLLIPNVGFSETLYDIDCVQRILDHFVAPEQGGFMTPSCITEEGQIVNDDEPEPLKPVTMVATLVDGYLAEVAPDVNLKLPKFEALAAAIPDNARPLDDGIYRAIDVYLKAHPWISEMEREHICRLMNCQKLSLEASTHAAQNERLPLRVIVQVLFFEQLRLRTSVSSWFFLSENLENQDGHPGLLKNGAGHVNDRVSELEKECSNMKQEIQKLARSKKSWKNLTRKLYFKKSSECCNPKDP